MAAPTPGLRFRAHVNEQHQQQKGGKFKRVNDGAFLNESYMRSAFQGFNLERKNRTLHLVCTSSLTSPPTQGS